MNEYRSGQPGIKPSSESGFFVCVSVLRWEISLVVGEGEGRLKAESWWKKLPLRWKVEVYFLLRLRSVVRKEQLFGGLPTGPGATGRDLSSWRAQGKPQARKKTHAHTIAGRSRRALCSQGHRRGPA